MGDTILDDEIPWAESEAKKILTTEILLGNVTKESQYQDVYYSNQQYQKYKKSNFRTNLKNLIIALEKKEERAIFERNAVVHDRMLHPRSQMTYRGYPHWDTSEARPLLKVDIDDGAHNTMSVDDFWRSREAYQMFPKEVFRKHIHQECSSRLQSTYWLTKQKPKKKPKKNKK